MKLKQFNPYTVAAAENKLKICEDERRRIKLFETAIKLRRRLIKSSDKLKTGKSTKNDMVKYTELLKRFESLLNTLSIKAEKIALTEYEKLLKSFYKDTLDKSKI